MKDFEQAVKVICQKDKRYDIMSYYFVRQALDHTIYSMEKKKEPPTLKEVLSAQVKEEAKTQEQHVSGQQLLEGIRTFVLEQYGPLSLMVLNAWGIKECSDFGHIVFNMVEQDILGSSEDDDPDDFKKGYDFKKAFEWPFLPQSRLPGKRRKKTQKQ